MKFIFLFLSITFTFSSFAQLNEKHIRPYSDFPEEGYPEFEKIGIPIGTTFNFQKPKKSELDCEPGIAKGGSERLNEQDAAV